MDSEEREALPPHAEMKQPKKNSWMDSRPALDSQMEQDEKEDVENEGIKRVKPGLKAKRERRQGSSSATLCQVCNIQLNSSAQAQIHYRGKTHQRRLRRLAKTISAGALSNNQVHPLLASLPLTCRPHHLQTHTQLEHFLSIRVNGSSAHSLFPNFNSMDPVQKAVIAHTFGRPQFRRKPIISCNICHLRFNSTTQAEAHYKGHKHARKLKAMETQRNRHKSGNAHPAAGKSREKEDAPVKNVAVPTDSQLKDKTGVIASSQEPPENEQGFTLATTEISAIDFSLSSSHQSQQVSAVSQLSEKLIIPPPVDECNQDASPASHPDPQESFTGSQNKMEEVKEGKNNKKPFHCPTCKVTLNSSSQLEAHCSGSKHKQMLDGSNSRQLYRKVKMTSSTRPKYRIKPRLGSKSKAVVGVIKPVFHCELCQVSVNSETQLKQHTNSRRHRERLAGKLVKPKFTPYNKLHPNVVLATKLALQKQLSKALPAGLLTSPVNPAALCTMPSGPLALRLAPGPPAIIPGPLINPSLFRPAPGPLRPTHPPIIFSPY